MTTFLSQSGRGRLINNPLQDRTPSQLDGDVVDFHTRHGLEKVVSLEVLRRGARVAREPRNTTPAAVPGITDAENDALTREKEGGFWSQTKELKVTILTTACAAVIQGWQQSTINTSGSLWACDFNMSDDTLLYGFINAAPPLFGSVVGTWLSDPLQEQFTGRRPALFVSALFSLCSVIGSAYAQNWQQLLVCRALLGIGFGAKASIAPLLAAEVAVDHLRGSLIMSWQLFDALGIFLGFAASMAVFGHWRLILASALIPAVPLLILVFICPESPRFLIRRNRYKDAYISLRHLRETEIQAARDLYAIHSQLQVETELLSGGTAQQWFRTDLYQKEVKSQSFWQRITRLVTVPRNRRACISAFIVNASQQLCGINILAFYGSNVFGNAASSPRKAGWFNFGWGLANFLFTFPAYKRIDSLGRRSLLLTSLFGMIWSLLVVAFGFQIEPDNKSSSTRIGLVVTFFIIFVFFYSIGAGPVPFTFSAEVFPLAFREVGMSFSVMISFLGLGLLVLFVPSLTKVLGHGNTSPSHTSPSPSCSNSITRNGPNPQGEKNLLSLFTGLNALAFILVFLFVPSTAKPSLEEMNYIFSAPTIQHVKFQLFEKLPWRCKRLMPGQEVGDEPRFMRKRRASTLELRQRHPSAQFQGPEV